MFNIVILTGAGISADSGLATFRERAGIWERYAIEDVATPEGFARDPDNAHAFYSELRSACRAAQPNEAHLALAALEQRHDGGFLLITQNVDDLHQRAGSSNVRAMHGEILRSRCEGEGCGHVWDAPIQTSPHDCCPVCNRADCRPDIVFFGEYARFIEEINVALEAADLFAMIGCSGLVRPASEFMAYAKARGAETVEINLEQTSMVPTVDQLIIGRAAEHVPAWVEEVITRTERHRS